MVQRFRSMESQMQYRIAADVSRRRLSRDQADKPGTARRRRVVLGEPPAGRQAARRALPSLAFSVSVQ
jgi:hypothetical protein